MMKPFLAACALALTTTACASTSTGGGALQSSVPATGQAASQSAAVSQSPDQPVWLCRPGARPDPCAGDLAATVVPATGPRTVQPASAAVSSGYDCFYVYPTVSKEPAENADLTVQATEIGIAMGQAERFSQVCQVWAPMYRQRTAASLLKSIIGNPAADAIAYQSLLTGWDSFVAQDDGRPIVFIGHSQGAVLLMRLLADRVDGDPALRRRLVMAIIAGGNVEVPPDETAGGTFRNIPLCTTPGQAGCVIAYSSFPAQPPSGALFGRPGQGVSLQAGEPQKTGVQVACVNPAALGGGSATLDPYFPALGQRLPAPAVDTPWVNYPNLYTARCRQLDGAAWLDVQAAAADSRPVVKQSLGPEWGYHLDDINLALGNLVQDVAAAEGTYARANQR